jgi:hypothetical protein
LLSERTLIEIQGRNRYAFAHDVYLEWSLFGLCLQSGEEWQDALEAAGDRPGLIRVVELLSQFEFENDCDWIPTQILLEKLEDKIHWSRVWLMAPFSSPSFFKQTESINTFLSADDRLIRLLSAFRSHKTIENLAVVHGDISIGEDSRFERFRLADMLSWPRPTGPWRRLLHWLLDIEWNEKIAVDVIDTFDVWLNLLQDVPNSIKERYAKRLDEILSGWDLHYSDWRSDGKPLGYRIDGFDAKLRQAFIRASLSNSDVMKGRLTAWTKVGIRDGVRDNVFGWANRIVAIAPAELAEFSYQSFISPLPSETAEHTKDQLFSWSPHFSDWDSPGIKDHSGLYPGSPLQQPFAALFHSSPEEALQLVRKLLARSAIAWRELSNYDYSRSETPLPVVIKFPWGEQQFWGDDKVYSWYRGLFASDILASALMALEDWAFSQLESGCEPDEIVKELVTGHESAAVLGIALGILLENYSTTPVALQMVSCQRLWAFDQARWENDLTSTAYANEMGASSNRYDTTHLQALKRLNARPSRKKSIKDLCSAFVLTKEEEAMELKQRLEKFPEELPYTHLGQDSNIELTEFLRRRAEEWAAYADPATYRIVESEDGDLVGVVRPPSDEQASRGEEASDRLEDWGAGIQLMNKSIECLESGTMNSETETRILTEAQGIDTEDLFSTEYDAGDPGCFRASGVAAAAAAILNTGSDSDLKGTSWAIDVAFRASRVLSASISYSSADAPADKRPETFAARALAAIVQRNLSRCDEAKEELVRLSFNFYRGVSLTALTSAASCWQVDSKFSSDAIALAFKMIAVELNRGTLAWREELENRDRNFAHEKAQLLDACLEQISSEDSPPSLAECIFPVVSSSIDQWRVRDFAFAVSIIPADRFAQDIALQDEFLEALKVFVGTLSDAMKNDEESSQRGMSSLKIEFERCIWKLAELSKRMGPHKVVDEVVPILSLPEGKPRSEIISSFADAYSTICVLDEPEIVPGTLDVFIELFDAVKEDSDWEWYGSRRLDFGLPQDLLSLVRIAMGLNWEKPHSGASRFVNGDWSDASILDPTIEWMLNNFGHLPEVVESFLLHTELAFEHRNSQYFASVLRRLPQEIWISRDFWSESMKIRLSALLQSFADRESPLKPLVHTQFLETLDRLAEFGDRRAAALQRSSFFDFPRVKSG